MGQVDGRAGLKHTRFDGVHRSLKQHEVEVIIRSAIISGQLFNATVDPSKPFRSNDAVAQRRYNLEKMTATSVYNPLDMFTSCSIFEISVNDASIHTLYRPAQPDGGDIVLVMIHGYPQTHVMWRSVRHPDYFQELKFLDVCTFAEGDGRCVDGFTRIRSEYEAGQTFTARLLKEGDRSRFVCSIDAIPTTGTESGLDGS